MRCCSIYAEVVLRVSSGRAAWPLNNAKEGVADGASVTLRNAVVNARGLSGSSFAWPAIACEGDATIVLEGENTVNGLYGDYPAIYVPYSGTLIIKGTGSLTVSANGSSAAIGSGKGTSGDKTFYVKWYAAEAVSYVDANGGAQATNGGEQIDSSTLVEGDVDYYAHWTPLVADWPEDTSTVASQTAAEAFYIAGDLANVNAKTLADWAKGVGNVDFADRGDIIPEAFLLNCANTAAAVTAATPVAEEAIKITAITFDSEGNPVLTHPATYGNGQVVLQGSATLGTSASWHDGKQSTDRFFRTTLKLK